MSNAKVVSLRVRPLQVSHLCFEVDGILEALPATLGASATAFDFAAFYATLGSSPTVTGDPSRLLYDFSAIQAFVNPSALAALRAEPRKAALIKAINARQNAFYAKYANAPAVIAQMNAFYSLAVAGSKPNRLATLSSLAADQASELRVAYAGNGRTGVVETTESALTSTIDSSGSSSSCSTTTGQSNQSEIQEETGPGIIGQEGVLPAGGAPFASDTSLQGTEGIGGDLVEGTSGETSNAKSTSKGCAKERQRIVNTDYGYRTPFFESQAQFERAQVSLIDEQFAQFMFGQNLPQLTQVFANELQSIDSDVFRLQIAFLNTILMSPIPGTVTGIYKNPGDPVRAGECVARVENNTVLLLVATLVFRGPITIGASVTVTTELFDAPGPPTAITGSVVAVRGQREDDQWEVIVQCDNLDGSGQPILPFGYHFDYDDTTVSIT